MTESSLLLAVRHCSWANATLFEFCEALSPEQLAWTATGTYGSLHATLAHLVGAEFGYLFRLTGEAPGGVLREDPPPPLDEILARERANAGRIERVVSSGFDAGRITAPPKRRTATAGVVVAQYVHHGSDHRAHVGTILGSHGVEAPEIDVWAYGRAHGLAGDPVES